MLDIKFVRANPDAVKENMSTNMTPEEMSAIIKMQLADMPDWKIKRQAIKGTNAFEYCYALGFKAATVDAIPEEEAKAVDEIVRIATEDIQTESGTKQDAEQEDGQKEETGDR